MCFVGPRQTEYASTHGHDAARRARPSCSVLEEAQEAATPTSVIAASFAKFASDAGAGPLRARPRAAPRRPRDEQLRAARRQSGSASQTSPNTAGISTNARNATSHQSDSVASSWCVTRSRRRRARRARRTRRPARAQYGGSSAHQGPSALKAFQKRVFAGCSSSDSSMSGTKSASIVGVKRCSSPTCRLERVARAGTRARSGTRAPSSPITTTSFGWTMCSSRDQPRPRLVLVARRRT